MVEIIVAIISCLGSVIGTLLIVKNDRAKNSIEQAKRDQKIDDTLKTMNQKLDEHNGYAQKFGDIAVSMAEMKKDIQYIKENKK